VVYKVVFSAHAAKQFRKLGDEVKQRLRPHIRALATHPRPPNVKKLKGEQNTYRIRVGSFRILYEVRDNVLRVLVVSASDRRDAY
jgi:mRNA interferase RelE/StbE